MVEIDINFNPSDFAVPFDWSIDRTFWEQLDENCSVPTECKTRFYVPSLNAKEGWVEKLKVIWDLQPFVTYDFSICNLVNEVSPEEIERHRLKMNKYMVKSLQDSTPVGPPETLSVQEYLESKKMKLNFYLSFGGKWENLSEIEQRIARWSADYGFLWDHRDGSGKIFPGPKNQKALKYDVNSEYFFHVKEFPNLILSLAHQPNSERPIYGFRREFSLDWPFDIMPAGIDPNLGKMKFETLPDRFVEARIVEPMNRLIRNIEYVLAK